MAAEDWTEIAEYLVEAVVGFEEGWICDPLGSAELALRQLRLLADGEQHESFRTLAASLADDLRAALAELLASRAEDL